MDKNEELLYTETIHHIADLVGIIPSFYSDNLSRVVETTFDVKKKLVSSMGYDISDLEKALKVLSTLEEDIWRKEIPEYVVQTIDTPYLELSIHIPKGYDSTFTLGWEILKEDNERLSGKIEIAHLPILATKNIEGVTFERRQFKILMDLPLGYHNLKFTLQSEAMIAPMTWRELLIIVAPKKCYLPTPEHARFFGFPLQLYALKSNNNLGIGDFSDLKKMAVLAKETGADILGVNPLNTLFYENPTWASPYSACSRLYLNTLYIDPIATEDFKESKEAQDYTETEDFLEKLRKLRALDSVDYEGVSDLKNGLYELLYKHFEENHFKKETDRGKAFVRFCESEGEELEKLAVFQVLSEHFETSNFRTWSKPYDYVYAPEVIEFAKENRARVFYFMYLQWLASLQLDDVGAEFQKIGLKIGLYRDLAVGASDSSSEVWGNPTLYAQDISIGSPPDMFNPNGQRWGLSPLIPERLKSQSFIPFIKTIRKTMKASGAIRIDHVMALQRLYFVSEAGEGAYVSYPIDEMLAILALESQRHKCLVIGEDLGTLPDGFSERLINYGVFSMQMYRELEEFSMQKERASISFGSHDMPTLSGFFQGLDIDLMYVHRLIVSSEAKEMRKTERRQWRLQLINMLARNGIWFVEDTDKDILDGKTLPKKLCEAYYRMISRTKGQIFLAQLEDIFDQNEQVNLPGTFLEYPNWRVKVKVAIEDMKNDIRLPNVCQAIVSERERTA